MNFNRRLAHVAIAMLGITMLVGKASAALIAYDNAGDSAYNSGTVIGVNGGYGWGGAWSVTAANFGGTHTVWSSSLLGGAGSDTGYINSPRSPGGRAWVIGFSGFPDPHGGHTTTAVRPFSGPLMPGQTFSIDYDADPNAVTAITLGDLTVGIDGTYNGIPVYLAQSLAGPDGSTITDFGPPVTDYGARISFMPVTDSAAQVTITSLAPGGESDSFILAYSTPMTEMLAQQLFFPTYLYMNNMSITPEPVGIALATAGLAMITLGRRRRPSSFR